MQQISAKQSSLELSTRLFDQIEKSGQTNQILEQKQRQNKYPINTTPKAEVF